MVTEPVGWGGVHKIRKRVGGGFFQTPLPMTLEGIALREIARQQTLNYVAENNKINHKSYCTIKLFLFMNHFCVYLYCYSIR